MSRPGGLGHPGGMEIRITLDQLEPPAGRLAPVTDPHGPAGAEGREVHRVLARRARTARWWPFVGSTAIAVPMIGPSYLADGAAAVVLISMHIAVGVVLIWGFARLVAPPSWTSSWTSDRT
jgi:Family of unknown function (DUF6069)